MKLDLRENMYVRNCYGRIAKIEYIEDNTAYCDNWLYQSYEDHITFINLDDEDDIDEILKASYNIIDILEIGDILVDDTNRKLEILLIDNELMVRNAGLIYDNNYYIPIKSIAIKSVITHEQMEQMAYKVGDK